MPTDDPLIHLLQSADAAANVPPVAAELPQRVRQLRAAKAERSRRIVGVMLTAGSVLMVSVFVRNGDHSIRDSSPSAFENDEIVELRKKADTFTAQADALENAIAQLKVQRRVADLTVQYKQLLSDSPILDPAELAIDQAAVIALCQGDFFLESLDARDAAADAYRSVVKHFPDSRWAAVASDKLSQLQMN